MSKNIVKFKDQFFAACPSGLESLLEKEIKDLKVRSTEIVKGGVHFDSFPDRALELMLASRIASRVYKKLYSFEVRNENDIYFHAKDIKWKAVFNLEQTFKIQVLQGKSKDGKRRSEFKNSMFLGQKLKDAICDRFRLDCNDQRPSVEKERADVAILMRVEPTEHEFSRKEMVTILIDMCGVPLSNRHYKVAKFSAPLRENLAAGLVLLANYTGKENLVDPMCGSGTIIIESLLIKGDIPPSFMILNKLKSLDHGFYDFMIHNYFRKDEYLQKAFFKLIETYEEKTKKGFKRLSDSPIRTYASDIDRKACNATQDNLEEAGLLEFTKLGLEDAIKFRPELTSGYIITNPPYGERLGGDEEQLEQLYHNFGETMKNHYKGFSAFLFTGALPMIKKISLRTSQKLPLYNGNIDARFVKYELF